MYFTFLYTCATIKPSKGKTVEEPKNDIFSTKTYTFDVSKYDEIFDFLVSDGQIIVPPGSKNSPLEQKQKIGFCKYHNFWVIILLSVFFSGI